MHEPLTSSYIKWENTLLTITIKKTIIQNHHLIIQPCSWCKAVQNLSSNINIGIAMTDQDPPPTGMNNIMLSQQYQ